MTFETELEALMPSTVTVKPKASLDSYGVATFGAVETVKCRIVQSPRMVRGADGREVVSSARVYTAGPKGIEVTDEITLPDGSKPKIIRVDTQTDEAGAHHQVVHV